MSECEKLLKEIYWRVEDTRQQLLAERRVGGGSLYNCDEWSAPAINLQLVLDLVDKHNLNGVSERT